MTVDHCRSDLAREERKGTAFIQDVSVIVDVLREQARSYSGWVFLGLVHDPTEQPQAKYQPDHPEDNRSAHEGAYG